MQKMNSASLITTSASVCADTSGVTEVGLVVSSLALRAAFASCDGTDSRWGQGLGTALCRPHGVFARNWIPTDVRSNERSVWMSPKTFKHPNRHSDE